MHTVLRTTDTPIQKDSKLTWRELWEIDVVRAMKEDFIEKDKDRSKYRWLPKMATCSKGSIGALLATSFCECMNSCANQMVTLKNTLLGDGEMEKLVMCRMNRDLSVFIRENYPQVANDLTSEEYFIKKSCLKKSLLPVKRPFTFAGFDVY